MIKKRLVNEYRSSRNISKLHSTGSFTFMIVVVFQVRVIEDVATTFLKNLTTVGKFEASGM